MIKNMLEVFFMVVAFVVLCAVILIGGCIYIIKKKGGNEPTTESYETEESGEPDIIISGKMVHTEGLPLASGVPVKVVYTTESILFEKDNQEISLYLDQIKSVDYVSGSTVKSNIGNTGAAAGFLFAGTAGAIIGGLTNTAYYLIICYTNKNGEEKSIILETYTVVDRVAKRIAKDFRRALKDAEVEKIEL